MRNGPAVRNFMNLPRAKKIVLTIDVKQMAHRLANDVN